MRRTGMSVEELRRVEVLARVKSKTLKVVDAANLVGVSYRQAKGLWKRYREEGARGLKHRSVGGASARAKPLRFRRRGMKLVREKYGAGEGERFGPTLAAEHLASEDGLRMDAETLRRWMLSEGLWSRRRKRKPYRQRRERRRHFGELVQMDGSFHDWLEERGPGGCLMNMTDDATSAVELRLGEEETIWAATNTLRTWIEKNGVPQALYVDWKNVYKRKRSTNAPVQGAMFVVKSRNAGRREHNGAPATDGSGSPGVGGGVCRQQHTAERVLPQSGFELEHAGSPSQEAALEEKEEKQPYGGPVGRGGIGLEEVADRARTELRAGRGVGGRTADRSAARF